jgi:hypothetical protein
MAFLLFVLKELRRDYSEPSLMWEEEIAGWRNELPAVRQAGE